MEDRRRNCASEFGDYAAGGGFGRVAHCARALSRVSFVEGDRAIRVVCGEERRGNDDRTNDAAIVGKAGGDFLPVHFSKTYQFDYDAFAGVQSKLLRGRGYALSGQEDIRIGNGAGAAGHLLQ